MLAAESLLYGRYRLKRVLGEGGMGVVWAAVNEAFGREVAIKVLLPSVASEPLAIERFFNEARICGSLRHPGIVDVLDVGRTEDGSPFLVMELLDGAPLDAVLQRAGTLRPIDILPIVRDVARTLSLAHARGVVHRDIKPANLFLHRLANGQVIAKVLDFGISKVLAAKEAVIKTRTGTIVGSPAYMSPEQALANVELDARSDVHALGVILYEALSGRLPFEDESYNTLIIKIATQDAPPLASLVPGLPKPVLEIVKGAMARDRDARIPSTTALADRIEAALAALGASPSLPVPSPAALTGGATGERDDDEARAIGFARTQATTDRGGTRAPLFALAAGGAVVCAIAALLFWHWRAGAAGTAPPARAGDETKPAATITVMPASTPSATAMMTAAPAATSAAPAGNTAAPRGAGSAAPTGSAPPKKKKDGAHVWGYD